MRDLRANAARLRFGVFEVNLSAHELRKHGIRIKLRGQPFDLLAMLLEKPGEVVTREEMRARLWQADTFVDFEHSLNTAIKKLRAALGDSPEDPRYIETLPRIGYRFIAPVQSVALPASPDVEAELELVTQQSKRAALAADLLHRPFTWGVILSIILPVALLGFLVIRRSWPRSQPQPGRAMLAVLPFENLTGNAAEDYFSDGLTEEMIAQLGRLNPERLGVIARTSVMHYKHSHEQLEQIGRELGVQYVLEGSVRRDSNKVRINAQLIQMRDQTQIWAREYDRDLSNLLALQGEIAQEIADEIQTTLHQGKRVEAAHQPSFSPQAYVAYDLYLKGRYFWNKRTVQGFQQAVEYFQQAIAKDPNYARAYAGLADSYALMSSYQFAPQNELMPKAGSAALRALQIDETLAEAHTSLALIAENYDYDWQTAEKEYRRAIQLDPNYATAHQWYAECLSFQGRFDEAFAESERARQLDPLSLIIAVDHGAILYFSRQYDRAIEQFRTVIEMAPIFPRVNMVIYAYVQEGRFAEALADVENWRQRDEDTPWTWAGEAYIYGRWGQQAQARRALAKLEQIIRHRQTDPTQMLVYAYVGLGKNDEAIALLQKADAEHSNLVTTLRVDPVYDPLRSDPRFQELMRRVGLPP
ncbi:MAG: tetratricopeptide repeat protein [Candidatus Acidiferrales bacterium]